MDAKPLFGMRFASNSERAKTQQSTPVRAAVTETRRCQAGENIDYYDIYCLNYLLFRKVILCLTCFNEARSLRD